jgi:hypothetical protein
LGAPPLENGHIRARESVMRSGSRRPEQKAIDVAVHIPAARHGGAIEVRPVETYW